MHVILDAVIQNLEQGSTRIRQLQSLQLAEMVWFRELIPCFVQSHFKQLFVDVEGYRPMVNL